MESRENVQCLLKPSSQIYRDGLDYPMRPGNIICNMIDTRRLSGY